MDSTDTERLRAPGFPIARRSYEQRAVDTFLARPADWLETDVATDLGQVAVTRKLELVGKSTAHILLATEQESEQMRRRAHEDCAELRSETKAAALATRQAADEYATKVRDKAEQDAPGSRCGKRESDADHRRRRTPAGAERRARQRAECAPQPGAGGAGQPVRRDRLHHRTAPTGKHRHRPGSTGWACAGATAPTTAEGLAGDVGQPADRRPGQRRAAAPPSPR
jgi:hypothetical protein